MGPEKSLQGEQPCQSSQWAVRGEFCVKHAEGASLARFQMDEAVSAGRFG
jgi:hypothetical protein